MNIVSNTFRSSELGMKNDWKPLLLLFTILIIFLVLPSITLASCPPSTWTAVDSGTTGSLNAVIYANNTYVAVGDGGTIITSQDGRTWVKQESNMTTDFMGIAYGKGRFVAVGGKRYCDRLPSDPWFSEQNERRYDASGNGITKSPYEIACSTDGITWEQVNTKYFNTNLPVYNPEEAITNGLNKVIFANNRFWANLMCSYDGTIWFRTPPYLKKHFIGEISPDYYWAPEELLAYGSDTLVAYLGDFYYSTDYNASYWTVGNMLKSQDEPLFDPTALNNAGYPSSLTYAQGKFVALGANVAYISSTGTEWKRYYNANNDHSWTDIIGNDQYFVSCGGDGRISFSNDGISWHDSNSITQNNLYAVAVAQNRFIAVGQSGTIVISNSTVETDNAPAKSSSSNDTEAKTPVVPQIPKPTTLCLQVGSVKLSVNGQTQTMDTAPLNQSGRTMLPVKFVAAPLGATINWDATEKKTTIQMNGKIIELWTGKNMAKVKGTQVKIDPTDNNVKPYVVPPGRTMLPLRFIAENLGCDVQWDAKTKQITITNKQTAPIKS